MNPRRPHPLTEPKQTLRPNALIFGLKENSRADWEAVGTKRIRNHESRQTCGSGATGTVKSSSLEIHAAWRSALRAWASRHAERAKGR